MCSCNAGLKILVVADAASQEAAVPNAVPALPHTGSRIYHMSVTIVHKEDGKERTTPSSKIARQ